MDYPLKFDLARVLNEVQRTMFFELGGELIGNLRRTKSPHNEDEIYGFVFSAFHQTNWKGVNVARAVLIAAGKWG